MAGVATVVAVAVAPATAFAAGATVGVATNAKFGTVLTDAQGFALYTLPSDHNGMSTCTGPCIPVWPALTVSAATTPTAGTGVPGTVASVLQANGTYQVTYNGAPLYTFVGDTTPGEVSGNLIGGFTVVEVSGATPTTSAPAPTGTTSPPTPTTTPQASGSPTTAPVRATPAPATAAGGGASSSTASPSAPVSAAAPTSLAFTGPSPGLVWMGIVGALLLVISAVMLLLLGDRGGLARHALDRAVQAGGWLLGR
ncbi:MAG TPA: hypothetical protein VII76_17375 [Acidimicrobiales bacterium]